MNNFIWLFPVLFVFHDFEEIIGFGSWQKKNMMIMKEKMPKAEQKFRKMYKNYSTEGMALAVFEELILCILICIISIISGYYQLWVGAFIAFIIHLIMHIAQSVIWKGYIPAVITSLITAPISIIVLYQSLISLHYTAGTVICWSIVGLAIVILNLKFAHNLMSWFTARINKIII